MKDFIKNIGIEIKEIIPLAIVIAVMLLGKINNTLLITLALFVFLDRVRIDHYRFKRKQLKKDD